MIRKVIPCDVKEVAERTLEFIGSTEMQDRDGEVIRANGWNLKNYQQNPVFMWAHNYTAPPIGKASAVWVDDKSLKFNIEFADRDTYEFADTVYRLYKGGFLKATSVGFLPEDWEDGDGEKEPRRSYTKQELLELSAVPVPSNPEALVSARDSGVITAKEFKDLKPETTENYHRVPVPEEEGKHDDHKIRTIDISKEEGIKALYCVDCKKNITYLFDKDRWSMEEAQEWVDEHKMVKETEREKNTSQGEIKDEMDYCKSLIRDNGMNPEVTEEAWELVRQVMRLTGADIPDDISAKVGATLNAKNRQALENAKQNIQSVLDSAQDNDEPKSDTYSEIKELVEECLNQAIGRN